MFLYRLRLLGFNCFGPLLLGLLIGQLLKVELFLQNSVVFELHVFVNFPALRLLLD